jgi:integrase
MPKRKRKPTEPVFHASYKDGTRTRHVTVTRRGGTLQLRWWDAAARKMLRQSLGHADEGRAVAACQDKAKALQGGTAAAATSDVVTVARLFALYLAHKSARKSAGQQAEDRRRADMWTRVLGGTRDCLDIPTQTWECFLEDRRTGAIDARGRRVDTAHRKPVSARAVESDCRWLTQVYNWAVKLRLEGRKYLLDENPVRGLPTPDVKNVRRPGKRVEQPSYLPEILDLAFATGRRLGAICGLWYSDYLPEATDANGNALPFGALRWRGATDKMGKQWVVPLNHIAQAALERIRRTRPGVGDTPIFPDPRNPAVPIRRHRPDNWLRRAEQLAGLEPQDGSLWHAYRRGFATARKEMSLQDVAYLGGWKTIETLQACYLHADMTTMVHVVTAPVELREKTGS